MENQPFSNRQSLYKLGELLFHLPRLVYLNKILPGIEFSFKLFRGTSSLTCTPIPPWQAGCSSRFGQFTGGKIIFPTALFSRWFSELPVLVGRIRFLEGMVHICPCTQLTKQHIINTEEIRSPASRPFRDCPVELWQLTWQQKNEPGKAFPQHLQNTMRKCIP